MGARGVERGSLNWRAPGARSGADVQRTALAFSLRFIPPLHTLSCQTLPTANPTGLLFGGFKGTVLALVLMLFFTREGLVEV